MHYCLMQKTLHQSQAWKSSKKLFNGGKPKLLLALDSNRHNFQVAYACSPVSTPLTMVTTMGTRLAHTIRLVSSPDHTLRFHKEKQSSEPSQISTASAHSCDRVT